VADTSVTFEEESKMPSLYERLGEVYAVAAVVDDFIDRIMDAPGGTPTPRSTRRTTGFHRRDSSIL